MFLIESPGEEEQSGLKAMNCPGHMLLFGSEVRSYRDLPLRIHEQSVLHRMEASGVLSGLTRVREFIMDDAHMLPARRRRSARKSSGCFGWSSASTKTSGSRRR